MRFILSKVSIRHQVILLSCHRGRHENLMRQEPELWADQATILRLGSTIDVQMKRTAAAAASSFLC